MIKHNQEGFTIIEMLIVVSIMTIIIPITVRSYIGFEQHQELRAFIKHLEKSLYDAQMTSLTTGKYTSVVLDPANQDVYMVQGISRKMSSFTFSKAITIEGGTHQYDITFTPEGTITSSGTIYFSLGKEYYKLVLLLGQGRFYVKKF